MAIPSSYTEIELAQYLHRVLGPMATVLGWTPDGGSYDEIINDALLACGYQDISIANSPDRVRMLRVLAVCTMWRAVLQTTAAMYDLNADGSGLSRSQLQAMAAKSLEMAETEAAKLIGGGTVGTVQVTYADDPYPSTSFQPGDDPAPGLDTPGYDTDFTAKT